MFSGLDFETENNTTLGRGVIFIIDCINFDSFRPPKFGALSRLTTIHINLISLASDFNTGQCMDDLNQLAGPCLEVLKMSAHVHL